jgi:hypothetical protein
VKAPTPHWIAAIGARLLGTRWLVRALRARHHRLWAAFKLVLEETLGAAIAEVGSALPMVELRVDPRTSR